MHNYYSYHLNILLKLQDPPYTITSQLSNGQVNITGFYPEVWNALKEITNFE